MESFSKDIFIPEYILAVQSLANELLKESSASKLKSLREPILKLLVNGVPADIIILHLVKELCSKIKSDDIKRQIIYWSSFYDNRAQNGSKSLFHLEALFARVMLIIAENNVKI